MMRPPRRSTLSPSATLSRSCRRQAPAAGARTPQGSPQALRWFAVMHERVLIIDDDPAVHEVVRAYLEREGYIVYSATNGRDRKSTRLNSSHANISYAVFCLK